MTVVPPVVVPVYCFETCYNFASAKSTLTLREMPLKDILKKKEKVQNEEIARPASALADVSEFTFMRTDTNTQEIIQPPTHADDEVQVPKSTKRFSKPFRKNSNASSTSPNPPNPATPEKEKNEKHDRRLSQRLHLTSKSRTSSTSSANIPVDLANISDGIADPTEREARWEERATILAKENPNSRTASPAPPTERLEGMSIGAPSTQRRGSIARSISDAEGDVRDDLDVA